jgi:hypothetical protein
MAANARHSCAAPHLSAPSMEEQCKGRLLMECGEQQDGSSERSGCYSWSGLQLTLMLIPATTCASPKSHAHQPPSRHSAVPATATMTMTTGQQRELCLSYVGAFRFPREATMPWHELSPAQHALSLARASRLPLH